MGRMRQRVLSGLTSTFVNSYKSKVNLEKMLTKEAVMDYRLMNMGEKYLVTPQV